MQELTLDLTAMAHGGAAMGRDKTGRPVFVPYAIPEEKVRASITVQKKNYARATLTKIIKPSPKRIEPRCPHFTVCGGCHFQHMTYETQLSTKQNVVQDQLNRIGGLKGAKVLPTLANPTPWAYRLDVSLSPTPDGKLGFWSPSLQQVMPIETCHIIHPSLLALWQDIDIELPDLRKLTLRIGDDESLLAAFEVDDVEPPELEVDFPVSVAIVLPDKTAASLVGDLFLIQNVKERDFRVSPGCFFQPSSKAAELVVDTVLAFAGLEGGETIVDVYSGVGMLTSFLAGEAAEVIGIERNSDAVADAAVNLDNADNITLYQGNIEEVLPMLDVAPQVVVVNPPSGGMSTAAINAITRTGPARLVYVSSDVATLARDGKRLHREGYRLGKVQPIDMSPQTFHIETVSLWQRNR